MLSEAILQKGTPPISREKATQMFPISAEPYAVWFNSDDDEGSPPWVVNDGDGVAMLDVMNYEDASKVAYALKASEGVQGLVLDDDQRKAVTYALLIGLDSYGEIERLINSAELAKMCDIQIPDNMQPIHPTGSSETIGAFAAALRYIHT